MVFYVVFKWRRLLNLLRKTVEERESFAEVYLRRAIWLVIVNLVIKVSGSVLRQHYEKYLYITLCLGMIAILATDLMIVLLIVRLTGLRIGAKMS
jgi:hypothetical protein